MLEKDLPPIVQLKQHKYKMREKAMSRIFLAVAIVAVIIIGWNVGEAISHALWHHAQ